MGHSYETLIQLSGGKRNQGSGVRLEALDKGMEDAIERNGWLPCF